MGAQRVKNKGFLFLLKRDRWLFMMMIPYALGLILFSYLPMGGIVTAFQKYNIVKGFWDSKWVGLYNFTMFFKDPYFFRLFRNTFLISFYSLFWGFPAPIILALLLNELRNQKFKRVIQSISYLPHFVSTVVIVGILFTFISYDGIINRILGALGMEPVAFRTDPGWFRSLYILSGIWQGIGWGSIVYLSAISGVDVGQYEAAIVDGANRLQRMWHITLPGIAPTIVILLILDVGRLLNVGFEKVYLMYSPQVYSTADVISTYVYRRGIENADYSYATAVGLFNSIISFLLVFGSNSVAKKFSEYSLW